MSYKRNIVKEERINRYGQTVDLPLFNQEREVPKIQYPNWIWDGTSVKAEVYNKMKEKFAEDSLEYLNAVISLGGQATDHEVKEFFGDDDKWPLHIVSARRNYFLYEPFYIITSYPKQDKIGPKGKSNTIWFVNYKNLLTLLM